MRWCTAAKRSCFGSQHRSTIALDSMPQVHMRIHARFGNVLKRMHLADKHGEFVIGSRSGLVQAIQHLMRDPHDLC